MNPKFWLSVGLLMSRIGVFQAALNCQTKEKSVGGMFLRGHTFETCNAELPECFIRCAKEVTCQSFNFAIGQKVCELSNRTKDARPEDFIPDPTRFYMKRVNNRGAIPLSAFVCFNLNAVPAGFPSLASASFSAANSPQRNREEARRQYALIHFNVVRRQRS